MNKITLILAFLGIGHLFSLRAMEKPVFMEIAQPPVQANQEIEFNSGTLEKPIEKKYVLTSRQFNNLKSISQTINEMAEDLEATQQAGPIIIPHTNPVPVYVFELIVRNSNLFALMKNQKVKHLKDLKLTGSADKQRNILEETIKNFSEKELVDLIMIANYLDIESLYYLVALVFQGRFFDKNNLDFVFFSQTNFDHSVKYLESLGLSADVSNSIANVHLEENNKFRNWLMDKKINMSKQVIPIRNDIYYFDVNKKGNQIAAIQSNQIAIVDLVGNQLFNRQINGSIFRIKASIVKWSPDDLYLAVYQDNDKEIIIYSANLSDVVKKLPIVEMGPVNALAWSNDGSKLAVAAEEFIGIYDTKTWGVINQITAQNQAHILAISWHPDNSEIAFITKQAIYFSHINKENPEPVYKTFSSEKLDLTNIALDQKGEVIVATSKKDGYIGYFIENGGYDYHEPNNEKNFNAAAFTLNNEYVAMAGRDNLFIFTLADVRQGDESFMFGDGGTSVAWLPDNKKIINLNERKRLETWTIFDNQLMSALNRLDTLQMQFLAYWYTKKDIFKRITDLPNYLLDLFKYLPEPIQKLFSAEIEREVLFEEPKKVEELTEQEKMEFEKTKRELEEAAGGPAAKRQKLIKQYIETIGPKFEEPLKSEFEKQEKK